MQFKLFTATIAAMAVGSAVAGPVPANDVNALAARDEQATQGTQQFNIAQSDQKANVQSQLQELHDAQKAAGKQVPTADQLAQIKQQVATSQQTAHAQGKAWWPYTYDSTCYDWNWWGSFQPYYNLYSNCWNQCGYSWNYCNNGWW
ncbi:hypothetical protein Slin14017_G076200 [Septoria linicola]|nr:hypothetical protein Slin14017_G076200 [Septoria linicola]